jgi:hypothetical protein
VRTCAAAFRAKVCDRKLGPTDEAKREFIFLALLRSHPTVSWIALGFPDGAFFGALIVTGQHAGDPIVIALGERPRHLALDSFGTGGRCYPLFGSGSAGLGVDQPAAAVLCALPGGEYQCNER